MIGTIPTTIVAMLATSDGRVQEMQLNEMMHVNIKIDALICKLDSLRMRAVAAAIPRFVHKFLFANQ